MRTGYYRKIRIDGKIVVTKDFSFEYKAMLAKIPKRMRRKVCLFSGDGYYYFNREVRVGRVKCLGAFEDKQCTRRIRV